MVKQFRTADVLSLAGITARQLYFWSQRGMIRRIKHGIRFTRMEALDIVIFAELRNRGIKLRRVVQLSRSIRRQLAIVGLDGNPFIVLVTGRGVSFHHDYPSVISRGAKELEGVRMVDIAEIWRRIEAA